MNIQKPPERIQIPRSNTIHSSVYLSILKNMQFWSKEFEHEDCDICKKWYERDEENESLIKDKPKKKQKDH